MDDAEGLAVLFGVGVVEGGGVFDGLDEGPSDEVGVGDFARAEEGAVLVDDAPVLVHDLDGDGALGSGEGDGEGGRHVLGDAGGGASQQLEGFAFQLRGRGPGARGRGARFARGGWVAVGFVEEELPGVVDGGAVAEVLGVELVFEPAIDAQIGVGWQRHGAFLLYDSVGSGLRRVKGEMTERTQIGGAPAGQPRGWPWPIENRPAGWNPAPPSSRAAGKCGADALVR